MAENVGLPAGFQLDAMPHDLPQGFVLDQREASQPTSSLLSDIGHAASVTGRDVISAAASPLTMAADAATGVVNLGRRAVGAEPWPSASENLQGALTSAGLDQPQNNAERLASAVTRGAVGAMTGSTLANQATGLITNPVAKGVAETFAAQPGLQAATGASAGAGGEIARQRGAGPGGQLAASMAAGTLPAIISAGGPALIKWMLRGGEEGRQAAANVVDTFAQAGDTPTVGQATGSRAYQGTENMLSRLPGGSGPMVAKGTQLQENLANKVEGMADNLAPKANPEQAGRAIYKGITGENSKTPGDAFMLKSRAVQKILYDKLDDYLPQNKEVAVDNTKAALADLTSPIAGAENLSATPLFKNATLGQTAEALAADLGETGAKNIPDPSGQLKYTTLPSGEIAIKGKYVTDPAGPLTYKTVPSSEQTPGYGITIDHPVLGKPISNSESITINPPRYMETEISTTGSPTTINRMRYVTPGGTPGDGVRSSFPPTNTMPYEAIKSIRTRIGEKLSDIDLAPDVSKRELKTLYGALSDDMEAAAIEAGPDAARAFKVANGYTKALHDRIDLLQSVIDKNGGPEKIFNAATSGTRDGATVLRGVMKSLPEDGQKMLSASILRRMGKALPGAQNDTGDLFSTERFLTSWNTMSPEAKQAAFSRYGTDFNKDMDALASIAANLRTGSKVFANPSGTAQVVSQQAAWYTTIGALLTGHPAVAGTEVGLMGMANLAAKALTSPKIVNWMVKTTEKPIGTLPAQINNLATWAKNQNDSDAAAVADYLKQTESQPKNGAKGK